MSLVRSAGAIAGWLPPVRELIDAHQAAAEEALLLRSNLAVLQGQHSEISRLAGELGPELELSKKERNEARRELDDARTALDQCLRERYHLAEEVGALRPPSSRAAREPLPP